ncbi:hypothetical protein G6F35_019069 [Rhizopus arrhizus]|nr:hypothetical protein G6F23_015625 [Rhizopus arrhizus]KAG0735679.1 hypothetical protein G6F24_018630 [Rhizopus arrhizus]KAG1163759.1 hypothetical protein G6F35_019069 [Rhizopus arrhizus]KAG1240003.1 hypothetical protein G6F68_018085 [Rhizopus microsporus]
MRHQRVQAFVAARLAFQPVALARRVRHQPLAGQQVQRLPDRRTRHLELLRQARVRQPFAHLPAAALNQRRQLAGDFDL